MSILALGLCLLVGLGSCKGKEKPELKQGEAAETSKPAPKATATTVIEAPESTSTIDESGITWIENDYDAALALARETGKPLVIDMWAAWCHTCLAMKKGTLRDKGLAAIAEDVIWLAIDTEDPSSAAVMNKFPPKVWPTFLVVSSADEAVQATQIGSASVEVFRDFVGRGRDHANALASGLALADDSPLALLRSGDHARMNSRYLDSAGLYAGARKSFASSTNAFADLAKMEISALHELEDKKPCAVLGASELEVMAAHHSPNGVDFLYYAASCAEALEEPDTTQLRTRSLEAIRAIVADDDAALSNDDRSDALATARAIALELKNEPLAKALATEQQALLKKAAAQAGTALEEMTYVWHQVEVHAFLGQGEAILPWVEALEARLPNEYDPPYRRAWLLLTLDRHAEAHAAVTRALPLAHGARKGRILSLDADIYKAEGNMEKERELRAAVVAHYEGLPTGMASAKKLTNAKKALAAMDKAPKP